MSEETFPGNGVKGESKVPQELLGFDEGKWCMSCPSLPLIEMTVELRAENNKAHYRHYFCCAFLALCHTIIVYYFLAI